MTTRYSKGVIYTSSMLVKFAIKCILLCYSVESIAFLTIQFAVWLYAITLNTKCLDIKCVYERYSLAFTAHHYNSMKKIMLSIRLFCCFSLTLTKLFNIVPFVWCLKTTRYLSSNMQFVFVWNISCESRWLQSRIRGQ